MNKPHKGTIVNWHKLRCWAGLGYGILGSRPEGPIGNWIRTSFVVAHEGDEIETRNSRYTLGSPVEKEDENDEITG